MLWLDVFLGWILLWGQLIFLPMKVDMSTFGRRDLSAWGMTGRLASLRDSGALLARRHMGTTPGPRIGQHDAGLSALPGYKQGNEKVHRWPDLPDGMVRRRWMLLGRHWKAQVRERAGCH